MMYLLLGLSFIFIGLFLMISFFRAISLITNILTSKLIVSILNFVENEFGAFKNLFLFVLLVLGLVFFSFNLLDINFVFINKSTLIILFIKFIVMVLFFIPIFLLYNLGCFFIMYLKGSAGYKNLVLEVLTDYINLINFFTRICIQIVRLAVISLFLFIYNNMYYEFINFYNLDINFSNQQDLFMLTSLTVL